MELIISPIGELKFEVPINLVIDDINRMPLIERFQVIAKLIGKIQLNDKEDLTIQQRAIIKDYLARSLEIFSNILITDF